MCVVVVLVLGAAILDHHLLSADRIHPKSRLQSHVASGWGFPPSVRCRHACLLTARLPSCSLIKLTPHHLLELCPRSWGGG